MPDGAHRQDVVTDNVLAAGQHIYGGGAARRCDPRGALQPSIESFDAAIELFEVVPVPKRFDGTEGAGAQECGIGLRLRA